MVTGAIERDHNQSRATPNFWKIGFSAALAVAVGWYMFVNDSAADNNVFYGFKVLLTGIAELPTLLSDTDSYRMWWAWMSNDVATLEQLQGVENGEGWAPIMRAVVEHIQLVAFSMGVAAPLSIVLGILVHRVRALRGIVVGVASVFLTIPSLALFALFIPLVGIGDRGPIIALVMYSILPILRNTVTGLEGVDRAVIESAQGVGLNARQRLTSIELPLAWPVILTGIRVATLFNIGIVAIAPLVGGTGLGRYVNDGLQRFPDVTSVERMWTGVVFTVLLAIIIDIGFNVLGRFTTSKGLQ